MPLRVPAMTRSAPTGGTRCKSRHSLLGRFAALVITLDSLLASGVTSHAVERKLQKISLKHKAGCLRASKAES